MIAFAIIAGALAMLAGPILALRCYRTCAPHEALIVHRPGGEVRVIPGGALLIPIVHRAAAIDLRAVPITIVRRGDQALRCADGATVEVDAVFVVRIEPTPESILRVASLLGVRRAAQAATLRELFEARFVDALRAVAATRPRERLLLELGEVCDEVARASGDLGGHVLDDVALTRVE